MMLQALFISANAEPCHRLVRLPSPCVRLSPQHCVRILIGSIGIGFQEWDKSKADALRSALTGISFPVHVRQRRAGLHRPKRCVSEDVCVCAPPSERW